MRVLFSCLFVLFLQFFYSSIQAQTIPTGNTMMEEYIRREQLQGRFNDGHTLSARPVIPYKSDSTELIDPYVSQISSKKINLELFPIEWRNQYNTNSPYGWNDGPMIPNRGYQTMLSFGFNAEYKGLSIQLKPEYVFAENKAFDVFPYNELAIGQGPFSAIQNMSDLPERMGTSSYSKLFWGQSHLAYTYKKVQLTLSTENLWWGPSFRNSLLMTNNAPGFRHLALQNVRPINTLIGSFSFQMISGILENSNIDKNTLYNTTDVFVKMPDKNRYLSGLYITYHPKWVDGLTFGLTRTFQMYFSDMGRLSTSLGKRIDLYFPAFTGFMKNSLKYNEDSMMRDQKASIFFRYIMPAANFELYGEYGREDHNADFARMYTTPEHSRAYILGFSKLFPLKNGSNFLAQFEMTNTETNNSKLIYTTVYWYTHGQVIQGYSNQGQSLGAGVGPGGSSQTLKLSWNNHYNSTYIMLERYIHDNDLYYAIYAPNGGDDYKWVDTGLTLGQNCQIFPKTFLLISGTFINNYQYQWATTKGRLNVSLDVTLRYKI
jgi:hypothetical protein